MAIQAFNWPSWKRLYVGKSGCGKSTLFWSHFVREKARVKFLFDHKAAEFCQKYKLKPLVSADALMDATARAVEKGRGDIVPFVPSREFPGDPGAGFAMFCEFVFKVSEKFRGRKLFAADELQRLVDTQSKPRPLLEICDIGRTYQIDCFFVASASNTIHNLVKNQITDVYAFKHGTRNATEWLEENGFDGNELLNLKKLEWRWRNLDTGEAKASR